MAVQQQSESGRTEFGQKWQRAGELADMNVSGNLDTLARGIIDYARQSIPASEQQSADLRSDSLLLEQTHMNLTTQFGENYTDPRNPDSQRILAVVEGVKRKLKTSDVQSLLTRVFLDKSAK